MKEKIHPEELEEPEELVDALGCDSALDGAKMLSTQAGGLCQLELSQALSLASGSQGPAQVLGRCDSQGPRLNVIMWRHVANGSSARALKSSNDYFQLSTRWKERDVII